MKIFTTTFHLTMLFLSHQFAANAAPAGWVVGWGGNVPGDVTRIPYFLITNGLVTIEGQLLTNAVAVAAGNGHALAIRSDGTVVGWGVNSSGQATGVVSDDRASGVVKIDGKVLSNVVAIAAAWIHSEAVKRDGTAVTWGTEMDSSKISISNGASNLVSLAGWYSVATMSDGTVVGLRDGRPINGLSNIVAISASRAEHGGVIALKKDGTVVRSTLARDALPISVGVSNAVAVAAGETQRLALKEDGTVVEFGRGASVPVGLSNVVAISAGNSHSLALKSDGTVVTWGLSISRNGLDVPPGLSNVVAIAAGNGFSLAITTNSVVAEKFRH